MTRRNLGVVLAAACLLGLPLCRVSQAGQSPDAPSDTVKNDMPARTVIAESPNHQFDVIKVPAGVDSDGFNLKIIQIVSKKSGAILASWKDNNRAEDAIWSPDSKYVAVNDRVANSGDFFYLVSLKDSDRPSAQIVRMPNNHRISALAATFCGRNQQPGKCFIFAKSIDGHKISVNFSFIVEDKNILSFVKEYRANLVSNLDKIDKKFPTQKDVSGKLKVDQE